MTRLARKAGIKRAPLKPTRTKRDWRLAIAKRDAEGRCRACGHPGSPEYPLECAHTVGRAHQDVRASAKLKLVPAEAVVPLCKRCHGLYDGRKLSLLGLLSFAELRNAVAACRRSGIDARRRLGGGR